MVGTDVGGTFTDFVRLIDGRLSVHKEPTTPDDQSRALQRGLAALGAAPSEAVLHGTTVATNALLERRGARTALLTTAGFADVLALGRQHRPHLYRLAQHRPPPLVPDALRLEVSERIDAAGRVLVPLDDDEVRRAADRMAALGVESVAVLFLFSFLNPAHERRAGELLRARLPGVPLTLSSDLLPEHREYERTATTVVNAYVRPLAERYLGRLRGVLGERPVRVMQSNGGAIGPDQAAEQAARLVLSGPAGGVVGALALARLALASDAPRLLTFDMGGTSTDVALCPGHLPRTAESEIAGLPLRLPSLDIHTVGAGGGSIARVDAGGALSVGPESAGAVPGPACYGRGGTEATVTDADVVLGRLVPDGFLGGTGAGLDPDAARSALARLGKRLGRTPEEAALGVLHVAHATMERALRRVSVERGHDPRAYVLLPFGGAGPLHACALAEALGISRLLIPLHPGVLSAFGLLMADVVYDASLALPYPAEALAADPSPLRDALSALRARVLGVLAAESKDAPRLHAFLDLRYAGQSYELETPITLPASADHLHRAVDAFHEAHARRYGHALPGEAVEAVAVRLRGTIPARRPAMASLPPADAPSPMRASTRLVWFGPAGPTETACYDRAHLRPGHRFEGPALILQYDTTILLHPGWRAHVDPWGLLHAEHRARSGAS